MTRQLLFFLVTLIVGLLIGAAFDYQARRCTSTPLGVQGMYNACPPVQAAPQTRAM